MFENIYTPAECVLNNQKTALTNSLKAIFHPTYIGYLHIYNKSKDYKKEKPLFSGSPIWTGVLMIRLITFIRFQT